jgi:hypothetical protein
MAVGNYQGTPVYDKISDLEQAMRFAPPERGHVPRDWKKYPYGSVASAFPNELMVPKSDWSAAIKQQREEGAALDQLWIRQGIVSLHQRSTSMCHMFAVMHAVIGIRCKAGLPLIYPSPAASVLPMDNWRDSGGWSTKDTQYLAKHGWNTVEEAGGSQVSFPRSLYTEENKKKALERRITEWIECKSRSLEQQVSIGIHGRPGASGFNRLGHAICQLAVLEIEPGSFGAKFVDNYGDSSWCDQYGMYIMRGNLMIADDFVCPGVVKPTTT